MMKYIKVILYWVVLIWTPNVSNKEACRNLINYYVNKVEVWLSSCGPKWTIKRLKTSRLLVTRYISGEPLKVLPGSEIAVDRDGYPKWLAGSKFLTSGNHDDLKFLMTLLGASRAIKASGKPDYSSITDPFKGISEELDPKILTKIIKDFKLEMKGSDGTWKRPDFSILSFARLTSKSGPSGHSLSTAMWQMDKLPDWMLAALGTLASDKLVSWILEASGRLPKKLRDNFGNVKYNALRRLALVHDPEMKCRVIAMADYWTQQALRPLHKDLFYLLRTRFSADRTFTQDPFIKGKPGHKFHSLDLSSATDRMPAKLQRQVLELMTDRNTAWAWYLLMTKEPFVLPGSKTEKISYSVGQPMGALSSWAMMALTHHVIVQYAAIIANRYPFKEYILLGDDIVICDDQVAIEYRNLMAYLGVDISEHKTHTSFTTYEFAKRWFHQGKEVTGLPLAGFVDNFRNPVLMVSQIYDQFRKGNGYGSLGLPLHEALRSLYEISASSLGLKPKWIKSKVNVAENFGTMLQLMSNWNSDKARAWIVKYIHPEAMLPADEATLRKLFLAASQAAISELADKVNTALMGIGFNFVMKVEDLYPELYDTPEDQHHLIYKYMLPYWAALHAMNDQNKGDILLTDLHDMNKAVEKVIVPNMDTAFTSRKSKEVAFGLDQTVKSIIKIFRQDKKDILSMSTAKAQYLAKGWTTGIEEFSRLHLSPSEREIARMMAELPI